MEQGPTRRARRGSALCKICPAEARSLAIKALIRGEGGISDFSSRGEGRRIALNATRTKDFFPPREMCFSQATKMNACPYHTLLHSPRNSMTSLESRLQSLEHWIWGMPLLLLLTVV